LKHLDLALERLIILSEALDMGSQPDEFFFLILIFGGKLVNMCP
jgi:hypothetical protein